MNSKEDGRPEEETQCSGGTGGLDRSCVFLQTWCGSGSVDFLPLFVVYVLMAIICDFDNKLCICETF